MGSWWLTTHKSVYREVYSILMIATPVYTPVPLRDSNMAIDFPWSFPSTSSFFHGFVKKSMDFSKFSMDLSKFSTDLSKNSMDFPQFPWIFPKPRIGRICVAPQHCTWPVKKDTLERLGDSGIAAWLGMVNIPPMGPMEMVMTGRLFIIEYYWYSLW